MLIKATGKAMKKTFITRLTQCPCLNSKSRKINSINVRIECNLILIGTKNAFSS